jgi:two-component system, cell cycle sensor histidine kinase and response regulator CckA
VPLDATPAEGRFRLIFEAALDAMLLADDGRRYVDANPAACRLLGRSLEELLTLRIDEVSPMGSDVDGVWRHFLEQQELTGEYELVRPDGSKVDVEFTARADVLPGQHLTILRDVTRRKTAEREAAVARDMEQALQRSDKLRAVGELTGGVAHDFNNLQGVAAFAGLAERRLAAGDDVGDALQQITALVRRGSTLVGDLLSFARREQRTPEATSIAALLGALHPMMERLISDDIALVCEVPEDLPPVFIDPSELERLLMNLLLNTRDAMPAGGTLTVAAEETPTTVDGRWLRLTVADTGVGMTVDVLERVFEPFFTTKPPGSGSGLGLAGVHGIVQTAGGHVLLDSEPGAGTTVTVHLPVTDAPLPTVSAALSRSPGAAETALPAMNVLLVEDQATIRAVLTAALERQGHHVASAPDGATALQLVRDAAQPFDLAISDVIMPGMTGTELLAELRKSRPELPAILMSGYSAQHLQDAALDLSRTIIAAKPFSLDELQAMIGEVLTARG